MQAFSGIAIKKRRRRKRITQDELSDRVGISKLTLWNWENGKIPKNPKPEVLQNLAIELDCEVSDFLSVELKQIVDILKSDVNDYILSRGFDLFDEGIPRDVSTILRTLASCEQVAATGETDLADDRKPKSLDDAFSVLEDPPWDSDEETEEEEID